MSSIDIIYSALPSVALPEAPTEGVCCVTGEKTMTVAREFGIKPTFTNLDILKAPSSDRIGVKAFSVLTFSVPAEGKKVDLAPLRQSHWIATDSGIEYFKSKSDIRPYALGEKTPDSDWCMYVTTSYKKHGALFAPLNSVKNKDRRILFESHIVDLKTKNTKVWWDILRTSQQAGIPRSVLETGDCNPALINKIGIKKWEIFYEFAHDKIKNRLYQFLVYLLQSQEELKPLLEGKKGTDSFYGQQIRLTA